MADLQFNRTINIHAGDESFEITGCVIIRNKLIFADRKNKRLIIHGIDGGHLEDINLSGEPFDVATINDNSVVVSFGRERYMEIIDIHSKIVTEVRVEENCWGLSYIDGLIYLLVDGSFGKISIRVFNNSGKCVKSIPVGYEYDQVEYITTGSGHILFTQFVPKHLACIDMDGNIKWKLERKLVKQPRGVTTDSRGNVFVVGFQSHEVMLVDKNGDENTCKTILTKSDGLDYPSAIYCDHNTSLLLVSNLKNGLAHLYNICCK